MASMYYLPLTFFISIANSHFVPSYPQQNNIQQQSQQVLQQQQQQQQQQQLRQYPFLPQSGGIYEGGMVSPQQQQQYPNMISSGSPFLPGYRRGPRYDISPCDYLLKAPVPRAAGGPFVLTSRARRGVTRVTAGQPIEVSIAPFSKAYQGLNFTSFIIYAKPISAAPTNVPEYMREFLPPAASPAGKMVGVFQVFKRFAAEAGSMKCSPSSKQEDSVGAYEDLILPAHHAIPARNKVSFLWWPDAVALKYTKIKFVANIKSEGRWYSLDSTNWDVDRPIDRQARQQKQMKRMNYMIQWMRRMERRADAPPP